MPATSNAFDIIPIIVSGSSVIAAVGLVISIALVVRRPHDVRAAHRDRQIDGASRSHSALGRSTTTEERLRELDELQHRRVISPEEYVRAREKVLSGR